MARFAALTGWFFTCLGITLLGVSILVVPADVFADTGSTCAAQCAGSPSYDVCAAGCCKMACGADDACYTACVQEACQIHYSADPTGLAGCCKNGCSYSADPTTCENNCLIPVPQNCFPAVCQTTNCKYDLNKNDCQRPGDECMQTSNSKFCNACYCTPFGILCRCQKP